jgi:tetratricopeptide (TPR) repeat protein
LASSRTIELWLKKYEEALKAFDYATLIDDEFLGAFMEKAKSLERLKDIKKQLKATIRTIELDDPTSYAYCALVNAMKN